MVAYETSGERENRQPTLAESAPVADRAPTRGIDKLVTHRLRVSNSLANPMSRLVLFCLLCCALYGCGASGTNRATCESTAESHLHTEVIRIHKEVATGNLTRAEGAVNETNASERESSAAEECE